MGFRYKAPESGVLGIVAVIPHHPVIIILESVLGSRTSINEYLVTVFLQGMSFVGFNNPSIHGYVFWSEVDGLTPAGNMYRPVIIGCPSRKQIFIVGI